MRKTDHTRILIIYGEDFSNIFGTGTEYINSLNPLVSVSTNLNCFSSLPMQPDTNNPSLYNINTGSFALLVAGCTSQSASDA